MRPDMLHRSIPVRANFSAGQVFRHLRPSLPDKQVQPIAAERTRCIEDDVVDIAGAHDEILRKFDKQGHSESNAQCSFPCAVAKQRT